MTRCWVWWAWERVRYGVLGLEGTWKRFAEGLVSLGEDSLREDMVSRVGGPAEGGRASLRWAETLPITGATHVTVFSKRSSLGVGEFEIRPAIDGYDT